jgi:Protein of unknown function (DUF2568)
MTPQAAVKAVGLLGALLLELGVLAAIGYWDAKAGPSLVTTVPAGTGAPVLFAVVWGIFGSRARPSRCGLAVSGPARDEARLRDPGVRQRVEPGPGSGRGVDDDQARRYAGQAPLSAEEDPRPRSSRVGAPSSLAAPAARSLSDSPGEAWPTRTSPTR